MKKILFMAFVLLPLFSKAALNDTIPKYLPNANVVVVKNVSFMQVCNRLLDSGYEIKNKDNDLQTVETEYRDYPKYWNAKYQIQVRIKDSNAYVSATCISPLGEMSASNWVDKKGFTHPKGNVSYIFLLLVSWANSFNSKIEYLIK